MLAFPAAVDSVVKGKSQTSPKRDSAPLQVTPSTPIGLDEKTLPLSHQHAYREATGGQGCITTILFSIFSKKLMTHVSLSEDPGPVVGVRNALSALARQRI